MDTVRQKPRGNIVSDRDNEPRNIETLQVRQRLSTSDKRPVHLAYRRQMFLVQVLRDTAVTARNVH